MKDYKADMNFYKSLYKYQTAVLERLKKENKQLKQQLEELKEKKDEKKH